MRTSLYSILCIVVRLGAVMLAVGTIVGLPWVFVSAEGESALSRASIAALGVATIALAAVLWIYPGILARLAAGRSSQQVFESPIGVDELQRIAFAVLGVWYAVAAIIGFARTGFGFISMWRELMSGPIADTYMRSLLTELIVSGVKLALGIALALGSAGLTGWLRTIREHGLPPLVSETDAGS